MSPPRPHQPPSGNGPEDHPAVDRSGPSVQPSRRGRPPGSVSLTDETERIIVQYVLAGAFLEAAALAAGISPRTLREWLSRGEGTHPTRAPTTKLRRFAHRVRQTQAQARVGAEVRLYQQNPRYWLTHAARTTPEVPGWSELTPTQQEARRGETIEDRIRAWGERRAQRAADEARSTRRPSAPCGEES